ncbi:MFS transporter (plasmid) [Enterococcus faecium]|uniref:MFS transporter n=1 Tax=Enterococcus faecium TaxID=1352 RepID=UPI00313A94D6
MSKVNVFKNQSYLQSSATLLLFFASWGVWWSFFQLWLTSESNGLGLSGSAVGTVFSANSLVTLILMFIYGTLQDKLYIKRNLLIFASVLATLVGPFFIWIYGPLLDNNFNLGIIMGALFLSAGYLASVGVFEAVSERFSRLFGFEIWTSKGVGIIWLCLGSAFGRIFICKKSSFKLLGGIFLWFFTIVKFIILEP